MARGGSEPALSGSVLPDMNAMDVASETITLGGGCFWCLEAAYAELRGVGSVTSGYAGGHAADPSYRQVCSGTTGHAEVVQIDFDPELISLREILEVFFTIHDPTTRNRQGADVGTQYRSVVFYHSDEQRRVALEVMKELSDEGVWDDPIVTELRPLPEFYPAEAYHRDYFKRNPTQAYCQIVIAPKLAKLRSKYADRLKP